MKKNAWLLFFVLIFGVWFAPGCATAVDKNQQRAQMIADSLQKIDSLETEALLDSLAAETDSLREALELERVQENTEGNDNP
ncbi:MAG: hypothetical protein SF052_15280 [Bacteroidia bacterium]|nr:hypothetical protein [Bacteroidia bacterium]